jgi:hypothetical protein
MLLELYSSTIRMIAVALMHQLTNRLPSELKDILTNDLTNNFTTRNTSKYDSYHFYRVVIDIRALKYSITGYGQF